MYALVGSTITGNVVSASEHKPGQIVLWHLRLGHVSEIGLSKLRDMQYFGKDTKFS